MMKYDSYPTYLYDDNLLNDVNYVFNKDVLLNDVFDGVIGYTKQGLQTVDFDRYRNDDRENYGKDVVMSTYTRQGKTTESPDQHLSTENIEKNVIEVIQANPEVDFYLFFPPYSILYYDMLNQEGELKNHFLQEQEAIELLVKYRNVHLYSFSDDFDLTTNFDNYLDYLHYNQNICSYITESMAEGNHLITEDNYRGYIERCREYYEIFDYESLFE